MNIQTERLDNHTIRLTVEIGVERMEKAKQQSAKNLSKRYRIPGFRPGKAPYKMIVNYVGEASIIEDAIEALSNDVYRDALKQVTVMPYGPGVIENFKIDPPTFIFVLPLEPEVDLKEYRDVRVEFADTLIDDDQVNRALRQLQRQEALVEESHQAVILGNQVTVDIHSEFIDGEVRPETEEDEEEAADDTDIVAEVQIDEDADNHDDASDEHEDDDSDEFEDDDSDEYEDDDSDEFEDDDSDEYEDDDSDEFEDDDEDEDTTIYQGDGFIHQHDAKLILNTEEEPVLKGFSEALVGANVGDDVVFELAIPDEEGYQSIVGRKVRFNVNIKKIEVITLPELNDDFAARITKDEDPPLTLLQLRIRMRENMQREAQEEAQDKYANAVLDKIVEQAHVAFPPQMVDERVHEMMHDFEENVLRRQGLDMEKYQQISGMQHDDFHAAYEPGAKKYVARSLILSEFVVREKLTVSEAEIDDRIEDMLKLLGGDNEANFRKFLNTPQQRNNMRNSIMYQTAMKHLAHLGKGELPAAEPVAELAAPAETTPEVGEQAAAETVAIEPNPSNPVEES